MEQERGTQVIYFRDLLFAALYAWRKILIIVLLLAVLFGGFQVMQVLEYRDREPASLTPEAEAKLEKLQEEQAKLEAQIISLEEYIDSSLLMKLDPYRVYFAKTNVFVQTEPEMAASVLWAYQSHLTSEDVLGEAARKIGTTAQYLAELVTIQVVDDTENTLSVQVMCGELQAAQDVLSVLADAVEAASADISDSIAAHTVHLTTYSATARTNQNLLKQQSEITARLTTLNDSLKTNATEQGKQTVLTEAAPMNPVVIAVVGAVLGACVVLCIVWIGHVCSDKVYSGRTLSGRTGIRVLSCVPDQRKRNVIDRWLRRLEGRAVSAGEFSVAAAVIGSFCKDGKVLIAGAEGWVLCALQEKLAADGLSCVVCEHGLHSVEALKALPDCDNVVLVECCGRSCYSGVESDMQMVKDLGKRLLGCVLLDG